MARSRKRLDTAMTLNACQSTRYPTKLESFASSPTRRDRTKYIVEPSNRCRNHVHHAAKAGAAGAEEGPPFLLARMLARQSHQITKSLIYWRARAVQVRGWRLPRPTPSAPRETKAFRV